MTTSRQKAIGSAAERDVAYRLGGERTLGYGPIDVHTPAFNVQVKCTTSMFSLNFARKCIELIPYRDDRLRGFVQVSRSGRGVPAKRTIVFDLDEFSEWYGR
jgi:hypothetical protein